MNKSRLLLATAALAVVAPSAFALNEGVVLTTTNGHRFQLGSGTANTAGTLPTATQGASPRMRLDLGTDLAVSNSNIFQGGWNYRVGTDVRERNIANMSSPTITGTDSASWTMANVVAGASTTPTAIAGLSAKMSYRVVDTGVQSAYMFSTFSITNNSAAAQDISLFFSMDMDLATTFGNDTVDPLIVASTHRQLNVRDGDWRGSVIGYGAGGSGNGGFSAIISQMTDTTIDNFIPDLNPLGQAVPSDYAELMQWRNQSLQVGQSITGTMVVAIAKRGTPPVPEPASIAALGLGMAFIIRRKKK